MTTTNTPVAMSAQNPSTPVTDDEQWSDETEGSSPQHAGYTPLEQQQQQQYQALGEEDEVGDDDGGGDQSDHDDAGDDAQEAWREAAEYVGRGSQQHDVRGREGWEHIFCALYLPLQIDVGGGAFVCLCTPVRRN